MVEHRTENPGVPGSIPGGTTKAPAICRGFVIYRRFVSLALLKMVDLLKKLNSIANAIKRPRFFRVLRKWNKHLLWIINPRNPRTINLFFGVKLRLQPPAAKDLFLWGLKSHESEIRLTKFLILHLRNGDNFLDIGAHLGFYSLLANRLLGSEGSVLSLEPSVKSFELLKYNTSIYPNIIVMNIAAGEREESLEFYELPIKYSEYNSSKIDQLSDEPWLKNAEQYKTIVKAKPVDSIIKDQNISFVKIDVEGQEFQVLKGMEVTLEKNPDIIICMEVNYSNKIESNYKSAIELLLQKGMSMFKIEDSGELTEIKSIEDHFKSIPTDSDNIIFKRL